MPRRSKRRRRVEEEHTHLAIRVQNYEAHVGASINHNVHAPQYAWNLDEDDPLYQFTTHLAIAGISTYPEERASDAYELTIYGDDAPSRRLNATLKDAQARDRYGSPSYREYRGRQIPVYTAPSGLGLLNKVRGERRWTAWLWVAPRFVSDALVLLSHGKTVFLAIHERKDKRSRWVHGLTLQTADPAEE